MALFRQPKRLVRAPAVVGDTWINTPPLGQQALAGKVVLVDFWTYSCINCLRTIPHLKRLWDKYRDRQFVLIGIHAPEFEFEKEADNVREACTELGVDWPVVLDNRYQNWHNFANRYWPSKYLVDRDNYIVYTHFGEGDYDETERQVRDLLALDPGVGALPTLDPPPAPQACFNATHETYCGYRRGTIANQGGHDRNERYDYTAPDELAQDSIALSGPFVARPEYVESGAPGAALLLSFRATEVNLVLRADEGEAVAEVAFAGGPVPERWRGYDLGEDSRVRVGKPRMYNLMLAQGPMEGMLSVSAVSGAFQAYAFTFSGCVPTRA